MAFGDNSGNFGSGSMGSAGGFGGGSMGSAGNFGSGSMGGDASENENPAYDFSAFGEGDTEGGQPNIGPFSRLLDIEGVDGVEDIFGNVGGGGSSMGGAGGFGGTDGASGDSPFGAGGFGGGTASEDGGASVMGGSEGSAPSGNPFANFDPLQEGNPFVEGDEPDVSFDGSAAGFGGSTSATDSAGGNPFGGASSGVPDEGSFAIGDAGEYVVRNENGEWFISDDDIASEEDTSLTNPEIPDVDAEASGNPFGGSPFEFNPTADVPDTSDIAVTDGTPATGTFLEGEVPEDLTDEELAVSSEVADSEEAPAEDSNSFGGNFMDMESNSNYVWNYDFPDSSSPNQDSPASDSNAPEFVDGNLVFEGLDFEIPLLDEEGNIDPSVDSVSLDSEGTQEIPEGINVPVNEDGELDLSAIDAPVLNEDGVLEIGDEIEIPLFNDGGELDIDSLVGGPVSVGDGLAFGEDDGLGGPNLNEAGVLEISENIEFSLFDEEGNLDLLGVGTPVLGDDNVLQVPGSFEIDLSEIVADDSVV